MGVWQNCGVPFFGVPIRRILWGLYWVPLSWETTVYSRDYTASVFPSSLGITKLLKQSLQVGIFDLR